MSNILHIIPNDILYFIKNFLNNKEIIELLCTKKITSLLFKNKSLFTSLFIDNNDNLIKMMNRFLTHKDSINTVILFRIEQPNLFWPFDSKKMVFINCKVSQKEIDEYYSKHSKKIIINDHYFNRYQSKTNFII